MTPLDDYKPLRAPSLPSLGRRIPWSEIAWLAAFLLLLVIVVQYFRGIIHEYDGAIKARIAAEQRADKAEKQLALMLQQGDQGVLIANIGADLVGWQVRLVPVVKSK